MCREKERVKLILGCKAFSFVLCQGRKPFPRFRVRDYFSQKKLLCLRAFGTGGGEKKTLRKKSPRLRATHRRPKSQKGYGDYQGVF